MARILGIDYGTKRVGIATTDPLQIIASSLETVPTQEIFTFLKQYLQQEEVEACVVGEPKQLDGQDSKMTPLVRQFVQDLNTNFPTLTVYMQDERYSSYEAKKVILQSGIPKKKRQDKSLVDKISAAIILQEYMEVRRNNT